MNENNSIEEIYKINLTEQTKFRISEISGIENYFYQEINQRKSCSKKLNKYINVFDYIDKTLIVLSEASSGVSIISFTSIIGSPVGIASVGFTLIFSLTTGIVKKLLNITRNKKKKHDKILMLAKSKLSSIETLISQALIDMKITYEEFITILNEKDKNERIKDNLRSENKKYMSNDTSCKQRIKLWDWVVRVKDTSCKATYKIKDLKIIECIFLKKSFSMYVSNWH